MWCAEARCDRRKEAWVGEKTLTPVASIPTDVVLAVRLVRLVCGKVSAATRLPRKRADGLRLPLAKMCIKSVNINSHRSPIWKRERPGAQGNY